MAGIFGEDLRRKSGQYRTAADFRRAAAGVFVDDAALLRTLEELSGKDFGAVMRSSTNKAMTPVLKQARRNLKSDGSVDSEQLSKSLGKKGKAYKRAAAQVVVVGPRGGGKFRKKVLRRQTRIPLPARSRFKVADPTFYAHLVEGGHRGRGRVIRLKGRASVIPGRTRAKPFIRPAFDSNRGVVQRQLRVDLGADIIRRWAKADSKGR